MFCKNCGEQYSTNEAVLCVKCGTAKGHGENFCHNCGKPTPVNASVCMSCGVALKKAAGPGSKSKMIAGLLGIFLGGLGIHNFYLGYTSKAVIQLVAFIIGTILICAFGLGTIICSGISIWGLIEGILILVGKIDVDGQGNPLAE